MLNASRRFRYTLDLKKEEERKQLLAKIRTHAQVIRVNIGSQSICDKSFLRFVYVILMHNAFIRLLFSSKQLDKVLKVHHLSLLIVSLIVQDFSLNAR